jgi:hypothetical protein
MVKETDPVRGLVQTMLRDTILASTTPVDFSAMAKSIMGDTPSPLPGEDRKVDV